MNSTVGVNSLQYSFTGVLISRRIKNVLMRLFTNSEVVSSKYIYFSRNGKFKRGASSTHSAGMLKLFLLLNRQVTSQSQFLIPSTFSSIFMLFGSFALPPSYFVYRHFNDWTWTKIILTSLF